MGLLDDKWARFSRDVVEKRLPKESRAYQNVKASFYAGMIACYDVHQAIAKGINPEDPETFLIAIKGHASMSNDIEAYLEGIRAEEYTGVEVEKIIEAMKEE